MDLFSDFINWYTELLQSKDNNILLATWGTTLATIGFIGTIIFKLYNYYKNTFSKVKVTTHLNYSFIDYGFKKTVETPTFSVIITNLTNRSIYFNKPTIYTSREINGEKQFTQALVNEKYPQKLEHGEQKKIYFDTGDLYPMILSKLNKQDYIKFIVYTTEGKNYHSNKYKVKDVLLHMEISSQMYK